MFTGYYMYTYTLLQSPGDNAKLELSVSASGEPSCLSFFYHMYAFVDGLMGNLTVFSGNTIVFSMSGNHGDIWIKAETTIYLNNTVSLTYMVYALHMLIGTLSKSLWLVLILLLEVNFLKNETLHM